MNALEQALSDMFDAQATLKSLRKHADKPMTEAKLSEVDLAIDKLESARRIVRNLNGDLERHGFTIT